jgi:hypothetical protein
MVSGQTATPLFWEYVEYQIAAAKEAFVELVEYARVNRRERGREMLVCGNFFNVFPYYDV